MVCMCEDNGVCADHGVCEHMNNGAVCVCVCIMACVRARIVACVCEDRGVCVRGSWRVCEGLGMRACVDHGVCICSSSV